MGSPSKGSGPRHAIPAKSTAGRGRSDDRPVARDCRAASTLGEADSPPRALGPPSPGRVAAASASLRVDLPCIGRKDELREMLAALTAAEEREGSGWLVSGPAGIGRSRLLRRIGELATQRGFEVRRAFGFGRSATPLWRFRQLLADDSSAPAQLTRPRGGSRSAEDRPNGEDHRHRG